MSFYNYKFPLGEFYIVANDLAIKQLSFYPIVDNGMKKETDLIKIAHLQLQEYFDNKRKVFDLPLDLDGTPFQKRVWKELCNVNYGQTTTYKQLATLIANPKAYRAVGMAMNKNPIPIIIPCHRVIGSDGSLTGYAGGLKLKQQLLDLEKL